MHLQMLPIAPANLGKQSMREFSFRARGFLVKRIARVLRLFRCQIRLNLFEDFGFQQVTFDARHIHSPRNEHAGMSQSIARKFHGSTPTPVLCAAVTWVFIPGEMTCCKRSRLMFPGSSGTGLRQFMFNSDPPIGFRRRRGILVASVACHLVVLVLALRAPNPSIVKVQQLRYGNGGHTLTRLYWSNQFSVDALPSTSDSPAKRSREQTARSKPLDSPSKSLQIRLEKHQRIIAANTGNTTASAGHNATPATAGSAYGSLNSGDLTGTEVRPALWISGPNPAVMANDLAEGLEGSIIVEITIDDQGNVVATQLLQSLSPAVDSRVIAALQMAHFIPAKRNGVSIASKQDVYYHFPK